ncbi:BnaCnng49620D [Brassica napus]|uniref:BnaCnng49620D protein n=1 Tax=Brassica napus TaxID=3708 RepID=A0A078JHX3_BRANA|nr:BnaCnng49620D [Brassica napus]
MSMGLGGKKIWCRHLRIGQILLTHIEEFSCSKTFFPSFKIKHIPKAQNTMTDKLARGARSSSSAILYVDSIPLVWLAQPMVSA